jgi:hypothetical protein
MGTKKKGTFALAHINSVPGVVETNKVVVLNKKK